MTPTIQRIIIWSGWIRVAHALIAVATLCLLATGGLMQHSPVLYPDAAEIHHIAAGFLVVGLLIRCYLLFTGTPQERFSYLIPKGSEWPAIWQTLRFYLLMGKAPLPRWYAHNPLWKPVYLLLYGVLLILVASGLGMQQQDLWFGFYLPEVHRFWPSFILGYVVLHVGCSIWHDYVQASCDVSAMINGYRLFFVEPAAQSPQPNQAVQVAVPKPPTNKD